MSMQDTVGVRLGRGDLFICLAGMGLCSVYSCGMVLAAVVSSTYQARLRRAWTAAVSVQLQSGSAGGG